MLRPRRIFFVLLAVTSLCVLVWQNARMQSPLRRITNTTEEGISINPSISGDGRIVAFESTEDIAAAGGNQSFRAIRANVAVDPATFLQMGATRAPAPAVSQDGSRIAFASKDNPLGTNDDGNSEIFLYDGAKLIQVTNTSPGNPANRVINGNFLPSISDDGRFIAFSSNRDLANQNADGNLEIFVFDSVALSFTQLTNSAGIVGFSDAKISGNGAVVAYILDAGTAPGANRDLLLQNRAGLSPVRLLASSAQSLAMTYGRAISDDGSRVVWSADTAANSSQVFLFDGRNNTTRQITTLGTRVTDVALHPTIGGDGSKIAFATRRTVLGPGTNSDGSVELYSFDIPSSTFARVTNVSSSSATADVVSSLNDDGSVIAFNFPRVLSGPVSKDSLANNSEIYISGTPARPAFGTLTILNGASFGHEPSSVKAVAPDSIAVAQGSALAFTTQQSQRQADGTFPTTVGGTTVTVNGRRAQIFFVSPTQVNFLVPPATEIGTAEVIVTNSDGFQSRGNVPTLRAAPGVFTYSGDGLGEGVILNADTLQPGPFDPSGGNLRLIIFSTGVRNAAQISVTAGGRSLTFESVMPSPNMPGMDEVHVLVPADLRGAGTVDLVVRADARDSNPVAVTLVGDARRDIVINEFLVDPPGGQATDLSGDANHDGVRSASDDEFIELVNSITHDINIGGYQILTRGGSGTNDTVRHTFASDTILPACSAIVVFGGGTFDPNNPVFGGAQVLKASSGSLTLINSVGVITLRDQAGTIVNLVSYGGSTGLTGDDNQSLTRSPDITGAFTLHQSASGSGGRLFSPGTQVNGAAFNPCTPAIARVEVSPSSATINGGGQQQFTARVFDANNNEVPGVIFSWQSSNTSVATIDQTGLATGQSAGSTEIRATGRGVQSPPATLTVNPVAPPAVVINEVDSDQAGTDTAEFVELYDGGTGNTSLNGLVIVFYNGSDDKSYAAFDLDGASTNANGYFTLGNAAVPGVDRVFADGTLQNGADAVALYVGNASDFPDGTPVTTANLIDALVYDTNDADDPGLLVLLNAGQPQVNEDTGGNGTTNSNQRCPNGSGGARNTSTYDQFAPTPDGANVCMVSTPPPTLSINDVSLNEGNSGTTTFTFTVSLSAPAPTGGVTFDIATADNTATVADNDYVAKSLVAQTIPAGDQTHDFTVTVNGDTTVEPNETFFVNVTNVSGANVGDGQLIGTIKNDDSPVLSINDVSASEGNSGTTNFTFTVTSSLPAPAAGITFDIATQDNTATAASGDYVAKSLTSQTITAGNPTYTFDVTVNGDTLVETNETFFVNVTNASGATIGDGQGQGTVQNDDGAVLVISQLYGGGGNTGAQYAHDFVEIFNRGTTTVDFGATPYSIQYAGAIASFGSNKVDLTSGAIAPGQYFLVQLSGGANGAPLPTPDASGSIAMAATAGKVALVVGTTALTASGCPLSSSIADFVGYGTTADCFEGSGHAPVPSNATADLRKKGGCTDTNDNAADFLVAAPFPRNTSSPINNCIAGTPPNLTINDVTITEGNSGTTTATFTVSLSAPAPSTDITFDIATQNNTATTANNDYVAKALTNQVIPAGQQTYSFSVTVNGDVAIEPDETFFVNVTNVTGATVEDGQGVGTIQNDDLPTLSINDVALSEGNSGTKTFTFTVSLSAAAPTAGVTFDIATQDNTATVADSDYVARSLTGQTIPAGSSNYTFDVTVNGDVNIEPNETFFVNVTNVSGATVANGQGQGTIQNDDSPVLSVNDVAASEGDSGTKIFTFTVSSSLPAPAGGISFYIATEDSTATVADSDYVAKSLTGQSIPAGQQTYTFDVTVNGDTFVELDEVFLVRLTNISGASPGNDGQGTIQNDDAALLVISQIYGGGGNTSAPAAVYKNDFIEVFNRGTTTVDLAGWSVQYSSASGTGNWSVTPLCATGPCLLSPGKYFLVQEAQGSGGSQNLPTPDATGTIPMATTSGKVALVANSSALTGACPSSNPAILDLVGYGGAVSTANFCFEGTGPAPAPSNTTADFRKAGGCTDTNDNAADFFASGPFPRNSSSPINNCVVGTPPNLTISDVTVSEGNSGTVTANFTVSLSAPAPSTDITFDIATQDNTATTANNDYVTKNLTSQVIPAGQQTYTFSVTVNGDAAIEPDENFFVNVTNVLGATLLDGQGVGTIQNDDLPTLTINDVSLTEGNSGTKLFTFTVSLSAPAPAAVNFDIATQDDTATVADNDYVARSLTGQTIPAGSSNYTFDVTVNGDLNIESNETFLVNVTNVFGAIVTDGQGVGTIQNDDSPSLSINDVAMNEGNSGATVFTFTVTSSLPAPAGGITFDIATADGTAQDDNPATEDNDYVAKSLTSQTIPATQTTYTFDVTVNGDTLVEPDQTFFVNITNVFGATVSDGTGQGTIQNDDTPLLVISQVYGGGGNTSATYTNDFIEIFNRGTTTIDFSVTPYSVQYAAATSNFSTNKTDITSGTLLAGHYFLVQEASGGAVGAALPTPDASGTINLSATAGKVALVTDTTALTGGGCPLGTTIVDFLGYGSTANCSETAPIAVSSTNSNARSVIRTVSCTDTNNNSADFSNPTTAPVARNSATAPVSCP